MVESTPRERAGSWVSSTFAALRIRDFRVLWLGTAISMLAFMMSMTAQSVVAFDLTGNNRAVGLVMFGQGIAMLALSPIGGALADRLSKRLVLLICQTVIGLTLFSVGLLIATGLITVFYLAVSSFMMGLMFSFLGPARQAYVGDLVDPGRRGNAVALSQVAMNLTRVVGPFLAGGLLAWRFTGAAGTYFFMAFCFVLVVLSLLKLPGTRPRSRGSTGVFTDISLGVKHVTENPRLLYLVVGFVMVTIVGFPYMTVLPAFTQEVLGMGPAAFGVLLGVSAVGGLIVSLIVASLADSPRAPFVLLLSSAGIGAGLILTGLAPTFAVALVTMFGVGGAVSGFQTLNSALVLRESEPAYYGRVMSLTMLAFSGTGLVALPIGLIADAIGERATLMGMGAGVLLVVALLLAWSARLGARPTPPVREAARVRG
jgi:predicted MFS family arabinose efflux permease